MKDTGERLIPEGHKQTLTFGEHLVRYKSLINAAEKKVVLDIASGAGYGTKILSKKAKKVFGVDYSSDAIKYASKYYGSENIEYIQGDATDIPLDNNSIDLAVSLETIEHISNPQKFIQEIKRILKKDGIFIVSTPNDDEFIEGNQYHVHEFDIKELSRLLASNFKHIDFYYQGSWYSSGVLNSIDFASEVDDKHIKINKTFKQKLNKAIYFMAVASDYKTLKIDEGIVISDVYSEKESQENSKNINSHINNLDKIISELEADNKQLNIRISELETDNRIYAQKINRIENNFIVRNILHLRRFILRLVKY